MYTEFRALRELQHNYAYTSLHNSEGTPSQICLYRIQGPQGTPAQLDIYHAQSPEGTPTQLYVCHIQCPEGTLSQLYTGYKALRELQHYYAYTALAYRYFPDISRYFRFPNVQLITSLDTLSLSAVRFLGLMSAQGACGWQSSEWHGSRSDVHHAVSLRARLRFPEGMFRCTNYPPAVQTLRHAKGAR